MIRAERLLVGCRARVACDFCGRESAGYGSTEQRAILAAYGLSGTDAMPPWGPATKADGVEGLGCPWCLERIYGTYARRDNG